MNTNEKTYNRNSKIPQRFGRWLMLLLLRGADPDGESFALRRASSNQGNAPPFVRRWYGCRGGLWRFNGKPVPIRTTRFRRT